MNKPRFAALASCALLAGCGRIGFDALTGAPGGDAVESPTFLDASSVCGAVPFNDGFDDGAPGPAWSMQAAAGVSITESNSRLEIALPTVATRYGEYQSTCASDNRNRKLSVKIGDVVASANGVQMYIVIELDPNNTFGIQYQQGRVFAFQRVGGTYLDITDLPYDPVAHRHWQLVGEAGAIAWELSPDGSSWDRRASEPAPFDLSSTIYRIVAGIYVDNPSPGTAAFEEIAVR